MINELTSLQRSYRMFRTLGLRHLCVVNRRHEVLGILTRADLVAAQVHGGFQNHDDEPNLSEGNKK
jgi:CBS domain-containing protein